jgi:hypothetical protein
MPAAQAQHMIAAGQAEYVVETAALRSPVDRMMRPEETIVKRRGRPPGSGRRA